MGQRTLKAALSIAKVGLGIYLKGDISILTAGVEISTVFLKGALVISAQIFNTFLGFEKY